MFSSFRSKRKKSNSAVVGANSGGGATKQSTSEVPPASASTNGDTCLDHQDVKGKNTPGRLTNGENNKSWRSSFTNRFKKSSSDRECSTKRSNSKSSIEGDDLMATSYRRSVSNPQVVPPTKSPTKSRPESQKSEAPIPLFIVCNADDAVPEQVACEATRDEIEFEPQEDEFEDSTYNSYRSILDDLYMEDYEDPYREVLESQASLRMDESFASNEDDFEVDILTPLPSHSMNESFGTLFKDIRLNDVLFIPDDDDDGDQEYEECKSNCVSSCPSAATTEQLTVTDIQTPTSSLAYTSTDSDDDALVRRSSSRYTNTSIGATTTTSLTHKQKAGCSSSEDICESEIANIVSPFANEPSNYFSQSAKAAAVERALSDLTEPEIRPVQKGTMMAAFKSLNSSPSPLKSKYTSKKVSNSAAIQANILPPDILQSFHAPPVASKMLQI